MNKFDLFVSLIKFCTHHRIFSVARHVGHLKLGSKPAQLYVRIRPLGQQAHHVSKGIIWYYIATAAEVFICLQFYTLPDTRVLNSFEGLCILRAAAENSFARVLNPHGGAYVYILYIYIYIYIIYIIYIYYIYIYI